MTIKVLDLKTKERSQREWTREELDAMEAARLRDAPTPQQVALQDLAQTEAPADLARKLEDLTANIVNGTPLPVNPETQKPYLHEWMEKRKEKAAEIRQSKV